MGQYISDSLDFLGCEALGATFSGAPVDFLDELMHFGDLYLDLFPGEMAGGCLLISLRQLLVPHGEFVLSFLQFSDHHLEGLLAVGSGRLQFLLQEIVFLVHLLQEVLS